MFQLCFLPLKVDLQLPLMLNWSAVAPQSVPLLGSSHARESVAAPAHLSNFWEIYQQKAAGYFLSFPWLSSSRTPQMGQSVGWAEAPKVSFQLLWD